MQQSHRISRRSNSHQTTVVTVARTKRYIHPHQAVIKDIIEAIKKNQKEGHEIFIVLDGNEKFTQAKGGIKRLCQECKLDDPFTHLHGTQCEKKSHIRGTHRIDFYLYTYNLLKVVKSAV